MNLEYRMVLYVCHESSSAGTMLDPLVVTMVETDWKVVVDLYDEDDSHEDEDDEDEEEDRP